MALITCRLCRKIFTAAAGRVCPECQKRLDDLYLDVRNYLRDNPKVAFNVETLADALGADIRDVQGLVDLGYLERASPPPTARSCTATRAGRSRARPCRKSLRFHSSSR